MRLLDHTLSVDVVGDRHSIHGNDAQRLSVMLDEHLEVEVGDGRSIQDAPQLFLARLHGEGSRRIIRVRHRHVIDGEVFGRLAKAGAVIR